MAPVNSANFRFQACVDWIELQVRTRHLTNRKAVRAGLGASHARPFDTALGSDDEATDFVVRLQDPRKWSAVSARLRALSVERYTLTGVELAVDGYPLVAANYNELPLLCAHLARGLENPQANPRLVTHTAEPLVSHAQLIRRLEQGWTVEYGHRGSEHTQRIYVKRTDAGKELPLSKHRARFENTYTGPALANVTPQRLLAAVGSHDFAFRRTERSGNALLDGLHARLPLIGTRQVRRVRSGGTRLHHGFTSADRELNARVREALRCLARRWAPAYEIRGKSNAKCLAAKKKANNSIGMNTLYVDNHGLMVDQVEVVRQEGSREEQIHAKQGGVQCVSCFL